MEFVPLVILLVMFLASLVGAYFASRVWHWAHVTLMVLIFLAATGYLILAAETMRIYSVLRSRVNNLEQQIGSYEERSDAMRRGTRDGQVIAALAADEVQVPEAANEIPSVGDLAHRLHLETRLRGPVWRNVAPAGVDPQTGAVQVAIEAPQPSGIQRDTVLFLFEQGPAAAADERRGAQYLGEFRVRNVAGQQVALEPVHLLDDVERQRLAASRGPWALYEAMPIDRYDLFAGATEDELRQWLPEESVEEYLRHGSPRSPDDEELRLAGFDEEDKPVGPDNLDEAARVVYQRRLRDYSVEFDALARERVEMLADMGAVAKDNERLQTAQASAERLRAFREEELRKLGIDLAGVVKDRAIIEQHLATVRQQLANARQLLAQSLAENRRLADQLAALEAQWKEAIDQQSSAAAPDGPLALSTP